MKKKNYMLTLAYRDQAKADARIYLSMALDMERSRERGMHY
jgi:hypothetical protein